MRSFLLIILICLSGMILNAQNQPDRQAGLDSLYAVWQDESQTDSNRVAAYSKYITDGYLYSKPETVEFLAEALHAYAKKHNYPKASVSGYSLPGVANSIQGNYPRALEYSKKCLAMQEELGNKQGIAGSLHNIGAIYKGQGDYPRALEYLEKARVINTEVGNKQWLAYNLATIGMIYQLQSDYPRALEYFEKGLAINEELGDKNGTASSLNNIGIIYRVQGNFPRALEYFEKSMTIEEARGDKGGMAAGLTNMANIYSDQGNYLQALEYYEKSLAIFEKIGAKYEIAKSLNYIGSLYQKQGNHSLALNFCQKGLNLAEEIGALGPQGSACRCLYSTYKDMGKGSEALVYMEKLRVVEDSLNAKETIKKLEQMEFAKVMLQDSIAKADEARLVQEAHQAEVRQKNQSRNIALGSGLFFLLLSGGFYSRWRYVRRSRASLQVEKDRSENLLLNILPAEIAEELKQKGRADARDFDLVSILFTDFKGFTEASAKLSAAALVSEINHCFEAFDAIMEKYGIEKIKTIGDAYMAAGGLPVPTDDSVKNTVLAALEMQSFITKRKAEYDAAGKPAFEMRVGIHTGPVVAGIVGVKKFQYDIWGDTVNTASRMESSGEVGKVNISQSTYELLKNQHSFIFESRGKIEAKGKGEIEMYFIELKTKNAI